MQIDKKIGRLAYGWTEEKTLLNTWFDPWAQLWRPIPADKDSIPTPAFSTSIIHALQLTEQIILNEGVITIIRNDFSATLGLCFTVTMKALFGKSSEITSDHLPTAISQCYLYLKEDHENLSQLSISVETQTFQVQAR
jgi:hypothetical protein